MATMSASLQAETGGHNPAPQAALELMQATAGLDLSAACQLEAEQCRPADRIPGQCGPDQRVLPEKTQQERSRESSVRRSSRTEIRSVAVVGAGVMGSGIAAATLATADPGDDGRCQPPRLLSKGIETALNEVSFDRQDPQPDARPRSAICAPLLRSSTADAGRCRLRCRD